MDCKTVLALIDAYLDGELDRIEARALETHLDGCPACAGEKGTVQFNWRWAKESPNGDLGRSVPFLIQQKKWRSGFLFQCSSGEFQPGLIEKITKLIIS